MIENILVDNTLHSFRYLKDLNLWTINEDENLLSGHRIDLEIDLNSLGKPIDWSEINDFISYLKRRSDKMNNDIIEKSNIALKGLFNSVYIDSLAKEVRSNIRFELSGVDYKGVVKSRLGNKYEYDLFFFPYNNKDKNMDLGTFVWRVKMKDNVLYGVTCDI